MKFGLGDFDLDDERAVVIMSALEDAKGGVATASLQNDKAGSGSAMPLCGIVLPLSKKQNESTNVLFTPFSHARSNKMLI